MKTCQCPCELRPGEAAMLDQMRAVQLCTPSKGRNHTTAKWDAQRREWTITGPLGVLRFKVDKIESVA